MFIAFIAMINAETWPYNVVIYVVCVPVNVCRLEIYVVCAFVVVNSCEVCPSSAVILVAYNPSEVSNADIYPVCYETVKFIWIISFPCYIVKVSSC